MTKLDELADHGQSIWYDFIRRDTVTDGGLADLIARGVRGVTSNPSIFEKAIADSTLYDDQIAELGEMSAQDAFEALAVRDIVGAADLLRTVYDATDGIDQTNEADQVDLDVMSNGYL